MPLGEFKEVLLALAGYDSDLYVRTKEGHDFGLLPTQPGVGHPERALLNKFAHLAYVHSNIRSDLAKTRSCRGSRIVLAVVVAIDEYLKKFVSLVLECENNILKNDATLLIGDTVSLAKLYTMFISSEKVLDHLQSVAALLVQVNCEQATISPSELIESLRAGAITGYRELQPITKNLLIAAEGVLQKSIHSWCLYGTLYSKHESDFFVQKDSEAVCHYRFELGHCPRYIDSQVAELVYNVGLIVAQLRLEVPLYTHASHEAEFLQKHASMLTQIRSPIVSENLCSAITTINSSISAHVLTKVLPMAHTVHLFSLLRSHFLLENGDFARELIERAENDFRNVGSRALGHLKNSSVQAVLAKTISRTIRHPTPEEDSDVINATSLSFNLLREEELEDEIALFPFLLGVPFEMKLKLQWPLTILITEADVRMYATIFNFLISIRRSEHLLHALWRGRRHQMRVPTIARGTWSTAFRALFFLQSLSEHYHANVINRFSAELDSILILDAETHMPSSTAVAHRRLLHILSRKIMLGSDFSTAMYKLMHQLDLMLASMRRELQSSDLISRSDVVLHLVDEAVSILMSKPDMDGLLSKLSSESRTG